MFIGNGIKFPARMSLFQLLRVGRVKTEGWKDVYWKEYGPHDVELNQQLVASKRFDYWVPYPLAFNLCLYLLLLDWNKSFAFLV